MKKLLSIILSCSIFFSCLPLVNATTVSYNVTGGQLIFDDSTGTITGYTGSPTDVVIPTTINGFSVLNISTDAFNSSSSITSVSIPDSVVSIEDSAFAFCTKLTAITVSSNNENYLSENGILYNKSKTTLIQYPLGKSDSSFAIPNSVTSIGNRAFADGDYLTSINISDYVTSIGILAFTFCDKLVALNVSSGNKNYSSISGILYNKSQITLIQYPKGNTNTDFTVPNSVINIGDYAFGECTDLINITMYFGILTIGNGAFLSCTNLSSINIPESIDTIGDLAFFQCSNLTDVTIPQSAISVGVSAFAYCDNLTAINVSASNNYYSSQSGILYDKAMSTLLQYPMSKTGANFVVPTSVTTISDEAFSQSLYLTTVTLGNNVTSIGSLAFSYCPALTAINISVGNANYSSENGVLYNKDKTTLIQYPKGNTNTNFNPLSSVTAISDGAFSSCSNLKSVTFPNSVTTIGKYAFSECNGLTDIILPYSITTISDGAFSSCSNLNGAYFSGNAPQMGFGVFDKCSNIFTVYYISIAYGFANPTWCGYTTSLLTDSTIFYDVTGGTIKFDTATGMILGFTGSPSDVIIPNTINNAAVTSIKDEAFSECKSLKSVNIQKGVTSIGYFAFSYCYSLTSITVDFNNTNYSSMNGVLYNKSKTTLMQYPCGKLDSIFIIPDSVKNIAEDSVSFCDSLLTIKIPESVSSIEDFAFDSCSNLKDVYFYGNAPQLGNSAFTDTSSSFKINYLPSATGFNSSIWTAYPTTVFQDDRKVVITKTSASTLTVSINNTTTTSIKNAEVIIALYDANSCLLGSSKQLANVDSGQKASLTFNMNYANATLIRAFIWDSSNMSPIF